MNYPLTDMQAREIADLMAALTPFMENDDDGGKQFGGGFHAAFQPIRIVTDASTKANPEPLGWIYTDDTMVRFTQNPDDLP